MRHYVLCYINNQNGLIEHIAVSDAPFSHSPINVDVSGALPIEVPGGDPIPALTYEIQEIDVDIPDGEGFLRGRDMLNRLQVVANQVEFTPAYQATCEVAERIGTKDFKQPFTKTVRPEPPTP